MLKKGDTIKCSSEEECIAYMAELEKEGYTTDFLYEKDGEEGLRIVITKGIRSRKEAKR